MLTQFSLETQYKGFNTCFWVMLVIATLSVLFGEVVFGALLGILGLLSGAIGQLKVIQINQARIEELLQANSL